jgi:hypothetical protein
MESKIFMQRYADMIKSIVHSPAIITFLFIIFLVLAIFILILGFYGIQAVNNINTTQKCMHDKLDSLAIAVKYDDETYKDLLLRYNDCKIQVEKNRDTISDLENLLRRIDKNIAYGKNKQEKKDQSRDLPIPQNVWIDYAEKQLIINWDPVDGAVGYNVYRSATGTATKGAMEKLNQRLITSDNRFVFIWRFNNGKRERTLKGHRHFIAVTAVFNIQRTKVESGLSQTVSNSYFDGFSQMISENRIVSILLDKQQSGFLPTIYGSNDKYAFIKFMSGPGRYLTQLLSDSLDFQEVGACDPVSTIALELLSDWGLYALRAEGLFIEEYHTFIVIKIENVEYILDFTADQFVPNVAPVLVPRDLCFLNKEGKLDNAGKPVYLIEKVYPANSFELTNTKKSRVYRNIYSEVYNDYIQLVPIKEFSK